jgi:ferredoxin
MTAKVDPEICIGCQLCAQTCPGVFKMENDKAVAYVAIFPQDLENLCRQATDECPVTAITL